MVNIKRQQYKPQWTINARYGFRDNTPEGEPRADFFSAGISFDLPLFTERRQDQKVRAAKFQLEAIKAERALTLRHLRSKFYATQNVINLLAKRRHLYKDSLLTQIEERASVFMNAYAHNESDVSSLSHANIAVLDARIELLNINIDIKKKYCRIKLFTFWQNHNGEKANTRRQRR